MIIKSEIDKAEAEAERELLALGQLREAQLRERGELEKKIADLERQPGKSLDQRLSVAGMAAAAQTLMGEIDANVSGLDQQIADAHRVIGDARDCRAYAAEADRVRELYREDESALAAALRMVAEATAAVAVMDSAHRTAWAAQQALDGRAEELRARGLDLLPVRVVNEALIADAMNADAAARDGVKTLRALGQRHAPNQVAW